MAAVAKAMAVLLLLLPSAAVAKAMAIDASKTQRLDLPDGLVGPESVAFDRRGGGPYVSISDGRVLKYGARATPSARHGGRRRAAALHQRANKVTVLQSGVTYPNGIAISADRSHLIVALTGPCKLMRYLCGLT